MKLLKCGCAPMGTTTIKGKQVDCCGVHNTFGVMDKQPDLSNRKMRCPDCGCIEKSDVDAAFFQYREDEEYDSFYSGCWGFE